jgi:polysaccharide biosynthesis/export protein
MKRMDKFSQFHFSTVAVIASCLLFTGCQTTSDEESIKVYDSIHETPKNGGANGKPSKSLTLREGDVVSVSFVGATNLNTIQPIRRDGKITLELAGEITAAGLTPTELEKEIIRLCGPQLVSKEVVVTVESSLFPVFVTGAVVRPGKIMSDRPISALQAIMEAGGYNPIKANMKSVQVLREENGQMKNYTLDLQRVLEGKQANPFNLKPGDIVRVPEKFAWF